MSEVLRLHGLGAVVEVRCTGTAAPELAAAMRVAWSRCLEPAAGPVGDVSAVAAPLEVRLEDVGVLPRRLMLATQEVTQALIGARAGQLLMFHAGAVSNPDNGHSLVFVARGGTGKTTLSRLLGRRLGYLTDETVGVDATGAIHVYPKPLSVRRPDEPDVKDEVSPDALGLLPAPAAPRVARLVLLDRGADVTRVQLHELSFMDAVFGLAEQSSSLAELPKGLQSLADLVDATAPVVRLRYSEAPDLEADLVALVGGGA